MATALSPLVLGGHVALGPLLSSPCEGLIEGGKAAEFAVFAIKQVRFGGQKAALSHWPKSRRGAQADLLSVQYYAQLV